MTTTTMPAEVPVIHVDALPPVARTLLIPLAYRALESKRPDAMVRDPKAVALAARFDVDVTRLTSRRGMEQVATMMRLRQLDRYARAFLAAHPRGVVVDIGCGLDKRFDRVDNGRADWYGLDLPEVIEVRRQLLPEEPRQHLIAGSVLDAAWMDALPSDRPALFLAEGVFPYLDAADVRRVVLTMRDRFPGAELAFDALSSYSVRVHNLSHPGLNRAGTRLRWALNDGRMIETWADGIRLLEEWFYFTHREPRLGGYNLLRFVPLLGRSARIVHYRLSA